MELEIHEAFISAGIKDDKAKAAVESINREMDKRYAANAEKLATKDDIADIKISIAKAETETETETIKWPIGAMFALPLDYLRLSRNYGIKNFRPEKRLRFGAFFMTKEKLQSTEESGFWCYRGFWIEEKKGAKKSRWLNLFFYPHQDRP